MNSFAIIRMRRTRLLAVLIALALAVAMLAAPNAAPANAANGDSSVVTLTNDDFVWGTYVIDQPGKYRLAEDITFNPNSPETLTAAVQDGTIPGWLVGALGLPVPVDAYHAGFPLFTQFLPGGTDEFTPGGPLDARYDPAAYGVGFFAAISITADDVVLDLNGHTIEQSEEHALLQRFFAVIELADQPFVPAQGPFDFGDAIDSATNVVIKNGTIGRSSHHGIHGNGNEDIKLKNVDFVDYEVGAAAFNGVAGLTVKNVTATNRKDVPVLGTFSSAQFIKHYIDELARNGSATTLTVDGVELGVADIQASLQTAINNTHADVVASPNVVGGRAVIDSASHPDEYALFHNQHGVVDGNSYSFLVNSFGVAVNGFPWTPDGVSSLPSEDVLFRNVHVVDQQAAISEVVAISVDGVAAIDPVGAVFQVRNLHPDTGQPITISTEDDAHAEYVGNVVANAQAFVAKANADGEFSGSNLDLKRLNIPADVLDWVEAASGAETLADIGTTYACNGDSMFHVNKGVIAYKMDAANHVRLIDTSVTGLENLGAAGSSMCGDYLHDYSHPGATLHGYGGAMVRGYTFAGSHDVVVRRGEANDLSSINGSTIGYDVITDSAKVRIVDSTVTGANAGWGGPLAEPSPTKPAKAYGYYVGADAGGVRIARGCAVDQVGLYGSVFVDDVNGTAKIVGSCS